MVGNAGQMEQGSRKDLTTRNTNGCDCFNIFFLKYYLPQLNNRYLFQIHNLVMGTCFPMTKGYFPRSVQQRNTRISLYLVQHILSDMETTLKRQVMEMKH